MNSEQNNNEDVQNDNLDNHQLLRGMPRRSFLKAIGATTVGIVASTLSVPDSIAMASQRDAVDQEKAISVAAASPLVEKALWELSDKGFVFDLQQGTGLQRFPGKESMVGIIVKDFIPQFFHRTEGSHLILTVDLEISALQALQFTVGRSLTDGLDISSVTLFEDLRFESHAFFTRDDEPSFIGPPVLPLPKEKVTSATNPTQTLQGCPTYKECTQWYYDSCCERKICYYCTPGDPTQPPGVICFTSDRCQCNREYRNCRNCNVCTGCGSYYSEWRSRYYNPC
jgi:hypothetical protein